MNKRIKSLLSFILAFTMILSLVPFEAHAWTAKEIPKKEYCEILKSTDDDSSEYYEVRTPNEEPYWMYVRGKTVIDSKMLMIQLSKCQTSSNDVVRVCLNPDSQGRFHFKIKVKAGNEESAEALPYDDEADETCKIITGNKENPGPPGPADKPVASYVPIPRPSPRPGYGAEPIPQIQSGTYRLRITRAVDDANANIWVDSEGNSNKTWHKETTLAGEVGGHAWMDPLIYVNSKGRARCIYYPSNIETTKKRSKTLEYRSKVHIPSYKGAYQLFKNRYMREYLSCSTVFYDLDAEKTKPLNKEKVAYIKKVSDEITAGAETDREKMLKIYEYVAGNFYYDRVANDKGKGAQFDPYLNLVKLRDPKHPKSSNSTKQKVTTVCVGYAAMVTALGRAQGIPVREVRGRHLPKKDEFWGKMNTGKKKKLGINRTTHSWNEAWIDGRWVVIDANTGSCNYCVRSKNSLNTSITQAKWVKPGYVSYQGFDPSWETFSGNFYMHNFRSGSIDLKYMNRKTEVEQLKSFLNNKINGTSNGKRLNKKYRASKMSTWGDGVKSNFTTDGFGRARKIRWKKKGLRGSRMKLDNFKKLEWVTLSSNKLTKISARNCSKLKKVYASYNKIKTADFTNAKKIEYIDLRGNKRMTSFKFYNRKKGFHTQVVRSGSKVGGFEVEYRYSPSKKTSRLMIRVAKPPKGYRYRGIYAKNKRKTKKTYYSVKNPGYTKFYVKYAKKK